MLAPYTDITPHPSPTQGLRYMTGLVVYDEALSDLDAQLRYACFCLPIFRGIAPSLADLNPFLRARIVHHLELYKRFLRPLMVDCLVFHHTPWLRVQAPVSWCVLEYAAPDAGRAAVVLYRLCAGDEQVFRLRPRGLDRSRRYRLTYDNTGQTAELSGWQPMNEGLTIGLPNEFSSELLLLEAIG